eukprot:FR736761.1.p1 GENE.FR736761.1~~FR736761.1.p1  ORF type:complete len:225 (+),score=14.43 FR736761.1:196-870(+)
MAMLGPFSFSTEDLVDIFTTAVSDETVEEHDSSKPDETAGKSSSSQPAATPLGVPLEEDARLKRLQELLSLKKMNIPETIEARQLMKKMRGGQLPRPRSLRLTEMDGGSPRSAGEPAANSSTKPMDQARSQDALGTLPGPPKEPRLSPMTRAKQGAGLILDSISAEIAKSLSAFEGTVLDDVQDVGSEDGTMTYSVSGMSLQNVEVNESGVTVRIQPGLVEVVI